MARIRADNTAVYLSAQKKVDPGQLVVMSYGETVSVGDNKTEAGRAKNRRVEILVYRDAIGVGQAGMAAALIVRDAGVDIVMPMLTAMNASALSGTKPGEVSALRALLLVLLFLMWCSRVMAQQESETEELAKKTQNPVADLISVPLQNNFNFGAGFNHNKMIYALNIQPVIPVNLNEEWNLITRIIMPIINQPSLFPTHGGALPSTTGTGFGDFNPTFFLSPAKPGELIWGIGPTFTLPTATDRNLGAGQFSMGPAGVVLSMQGHWVFGALMNNQWSVAGWGDKPVNAMLLQPFINYNLPDGWYLTSAPILTADWKADKAGDVWTVPVGGGFGKLFRLGEILPLEGQPFAKLPINTQLAAYGNVATPEFGPKWQLRFQIQFLFPK